MATVDKCQRTVKGLWIRMSIWESKDLNWFEKCLLAEIDSLDGPDGCYATNGYLAKMMGSGESTVANALCSLRKKGLIRTVTPIDQKRVIRVTAQGSSDPQPEGSRNQEPLLKSVKGGYSNREGGVTESGNIEYNIENRREESSSDKSNDGKLLEPGKPKTGTTEFISWWTENFLRITGKTYMVAHGKDGANVKRLLSQISLEEAKSVALAAWEAPADLFFCRKSAWSISGFTSKFNEIRNELSKEARAKKHKVLDGKYGPTPTSEVGQAPEIAAFLARHDSK